jgi:hypothetical protein
MGESTLSASDVAMLNRSNDDGWGNNGFMWIFALLILFWGGNGAWGGGYNRSNGEPVTEAGLCNAMNFNDLENSVGRLNDTVQQNQMSINRDLCTGLSALNSAVLENRFDNKQCCCETQQAILENRYLAAQNTAEINANTTAQVQKVLDTLCGNRMADMQNQINGLQLQASLAGVVRYPNGFTYAAQNPFCSCNCGNV